MTDYNEATQAFWALLTEEDRHEIEQSAEFARDQVSHAISQAAQAKINAAANVAMDQALVQEFEALAQQYPQAQEYITSYLTARQQAQIEGLRQAFGS